MIWIISPLNGIFFKDLTFVDEFIVGGHRLIRKPSFFPIQMYIKMYMYAYAFIIDQFFLSDCNIPRGFPLFEFLMECTLVLYSFIKISIKHLWNSTYRYKPLNICIDVVMFTWIVLACMANGQRLAIKDSLFLYTFT